MPYPAQPPMKIKGIVANCARLPRVICRAMWHAATWAISYAVFCLKKKKKAKHRNRPTGEQRASAARSEAFHQHAPARWDTEHTSGQWEPAPTSEQPPTHSRH